MVAIRSNKEYWSELAENGWLYSYLKDGVPEGFVNQFVGFLYPISILFILTVVLILYSGLTQRQKNVKSFVTSIGTASLLGWVWGVWMLHADPVFPGWIFPPWAVTNIEFILPLEDWFFYPACTSLFYIIYRKIEMEDVVSHRVLIINSILGVYLLITLFYLFYTALCGRSVAILFAFPGLMLFVYARDVINIKKFMYFLVILVSINCIWDWVAVSWIHSIDNSAWASQWIYLSFNKMGEPIHSNIFLDYKEYPWAWVFNNPIENTPWLGLSGAILDFSLFAAVDKYFSKRNMLIPG